MKKNSQQPVKTPLSGTAMKAAAFFSLGILCAAQIPLNALTSGIVLGVMILLTCIFIKKERPGNILTVSTLICAGMFAFSAQNTVQRPLPVPPEFTFIPVKAEGSLSGDARIRSGSTYFTLACRKISIDSTVYSEIGLLPCVLYNKSLFLTDGSQVILRGSIKSIRHPLAQKKIWNTPGKAPFTVRLNIDSSSPGITVADRGGFFSGLRKTFSGLIDRYDFMGQNGLLQALTIGDLRGLSPETRAEFTQTGIAHLLAVSGMNVGVLAVCLNYLLLFLPVGKQIRLFAVIILLFLYTGICGFQPPISRAFLMAAILLGARFFERPPRMEHTLFLAVLIILVIDPEALGGASLQLSFAAVWALITFYTPVMNLFRGKLLTRGYLRPVTGLIIATSVCTLATAPIVAAHFGAIPFLALPVNIPAVPLANCITVLGMASTGIIALGTFAAPLAQLFAFVTGILLSSLAHLALYASKIPLASLPVGNASPLFGIGMAIWLYILSRSRGRPVFQKALLYIPLTLILVFTWRPVTEAFQKKGEGTAVFFDVGQGDSALIENPGGLDFLVDTGPAWRDHSAAESMVIPSLRNAGIKKLDGVFLSHMDTDHVGGLLFILKNMPVKALYCRATICDSLRKLYGERVIGLSAGDSLSFPGGGILIVSSGEYSMVNHSENNASLLMRLNLGKSAIIFTGDIEKDLQHALLPWGKVLRAEVLKIPHHGAAGLDSDFVKAIGPETAIISCGIKNRYGHPALTTLNLLDRLRCSIHRTDLEGSILFRPPHPPEAADGAF
jgi:competence protein ComEC